MERVDFIVEGRECQLTVVSAAAVPAEHASEGPGPADHAGPSRPVSSVGPTTQSTDPAGAAGPGPDVLLIEPIDRRDLDFLDREVDFLREHAGCSFALSTFIVEDWNGDLSPWKADPVFGKEAFGDGAGKTLRFIEEALIPEAQRRLSGLAHHRDAGIGKSHQGTAGLDCQGINKLPQGTAGLDCQGINKSHQGTAGLDCQGRNKLPQGTAGLDCQGINKSHQGTDGKNCQVVGPAVEVILGGYSLAALFALWASYESRRFSGIAAASPSVWFPGWLDYAKARKPRAERIYLSLGDAEPRTRNRVMATVGDCIQEMDALLAGHPHTLEWNPGNHFKDADLRTAKAFLWCLEQR